VLIGTLGKLISIAKHQRMTTMDMGITLRPNPAVLSQTLKPSMILLQIDTESFYELNQTAARFWQLLEAGQTLTEIQICLRNEYDVDEKQLADEITNIVTMLRNEGLVIADE
jgi:hypothetical protein